MRKLAIVIYRLGTHGPSLIRLKILTELLRRGYKVDLVMNTLDGDQSHMIPRGCNIFTLGADRPLNFVKELGGYLKNERPDGVIASSWPYSAASILAVRLYAPKIKIIVSEHADFRTNLEKSGEFTSKDKFLIKYFSRYVYQLATKVVGVSQGVVDGLCSVTGLAKNKTVVIHNPLRAIGVDPFSLEREVTLRDQFWIPGSIKLLAIGRLVPEKNYDLMIEAFRYMDEKSTLRLIVIGEGALHTKIQRKIDCYGLQEHILLVGKVSNVDQFYSKADAFLMSSSSEGFGNVIVEALSFGLPVVSTDCLSGPAEILQNGEYGILAPVDDPEGFASGIKQVLSTKWDTESLIMRSRDFSVQKATDQYISALFAS